MLTFVVDRNGIPICSVKKVDTWVLIDRDEQLYKIVQKDRRVRIPVLWPFKTMTVLFHEVRFSTVLLDGEEVEELIRVDSRYVMRLWVFLLVGNRYSSVSTVSFIQLH